MNRGTEKANTKQIRRWCAQHLESIERDLESKVKNVGTKLPQGFHGSEVVLILSQNQSIS